LEGYQVIDPKTFRIVLDAPVAPMLGQLGVQAAIVPKHILGSAKPDELDKHPFWQNPTVGSGPFKFVRYQTDQFVELDRNDNHFLGAASFPKLILRISNQDVVQAQLQKGEVDIAAVTPDDADRLKGTASLNVLRFPTTVAQALYVNLERPYLQDVHVRQAMAYALDRAKIAETANGDPALACNGPVNAPAWAVSPTLTKYPLDQNKARQLLKDASWDSTRKVVYRYPTGNKGREKMGPLVQDAFKAVGIELDLRLSDFATLQKDAASGEFDLLSLGNQNGYDPDSLANQYLSDAFPPAGVNFGHYKNSRVDEIFKTAAVTSDQAQRAKLYQEFQDIVTQELPRIWVMLDPEVMAVNKRISGVVPAPAGGILRSSYWNIFQWTVTD
jgi:peptide/nickel transport system substrate-binding protein